MLESLLYRAHQLRVPFHPPFEPAAVEAAARALAAVEIGELLAAVVGHHSTVKAVRDRLQTLHAAAQVFASRRRPAARSWRRSIRSSARAKKASTT